MKSINDLLFRWRFNAEARGEFYEQLANYTSDDLPLYECLQDMHKGLSKEKSFLASMVARVMGRLRGMEGGALELGQALNGYCPAAELAMISAGERAGDISLGLRKAQHLALSQQRLNSAIVSEMVQPAVYLLMIAGLLVVLSRAILPAMETGTPRFNWPVYARYLGILADSAIVLVIAVAVLVVCWAAAFAVTANRLTGPVREALDKWLFPWGLYSKMNEAVLLLTIASMIRVGLPFETAVDSIQRRSSDYMRNKLAPVRSGLKRGQSVGDSLVLAINDSKVRWQVAMYSKSTKFAMGLEKLADRGVEALIKNTKRLFGAIGFGVLVLIAAMVLWVLGSFFGVSMSVRTSRF